MHPSYSYLDLNVGSPLKAIPPGSARLQSWMARAVDRPGFPLDREVQIAGAIGIVRGLEYHYRRFMDGVLALDPLKSRLQQSLGSSDLHHRLPTPAEFELLADLDHEAVAYINRVGQLYYFARAWQLESYVPQAVALLPFRNKYTAHRSIDEPRAESPHERQLQATAFGFGHTLVGGFPVFQIQTKDAWVEFIMKDAHPALLSEVVTLFDAIFALPADA